MWMMVVHFVYELKLENILIFLLLYCFSYITILHCSSIHSIVISFFHPICVWRIHNFKYSMLDEWLVPKKQKKKRKNINSFRPWNFFCFPKYNSFWTGETDCSTSNLSLALPYIHLFMFVNNLFELKIDFKINGQPIWWIWLKSDRIEWGTMKKRPTSPSTRSIIRWKKKQ